MARKFIPLFFLVKILNIKNFFPENSFVENLKENKFARGALILLVGGLICKLIGAIYRIPLSNILGPEGIGIYQLVFPIFSLFLILASGGSATALSKLVASCRAKGENKRARRFLFQSIILLLVVSLVFSGLFLAFGGPLSSFQGNEKAALGYVGAAIAIVFASVLTAFRGYFQGYQNMTPTAVSQIIEQVLKLVLGLTFAHLLIGRGPAYGAMGAMIGVGVSEIFALLYLAITYAFKRKKLDILEPEIETTFSQDLKLLIKQTLPITLNSLIMPLILAIDSFLIVNLLVSSGNSSEISTEMFGVYSGMVNSLVNFPTVFSMALAISLVPAISYGREKREKNLDASSVFKLIFYIAIPCIFIYFCFSREIIAVLYPSATNQNLLSLGALLLRISAINILYISLLQITTAILQGNGKSLAALANVSVAGVIKILLTLVFVSGVFGIYGAAIASAICYSIAAGLNIITLRYEFNFSIKFKPIFFIFLNSLISLGVAIGFNYLFNLTFSGLISIIFSLLIAGLIYLIFSIILPIFNDEELSKIPLGSKIVTFKNKFFNLFKFKKKI